MSKEKTLFTIEGKIFEDESRVVTINGITLQLKDVAKVEAPSSPGGFSWGYSGSAPYTLAFAILMKFIPEEQWNSIDSKMRHAFERDFIRGWGNGNFMVEIDIIAWLNEYGYKGEIAFVHVLQKVS